MASVTSLITPETKVKVSSILDKSVGKKNLTDGSPETCWTSSQGIPQYIQLGFNAPVLPTKIVITFQGGFVGTRCAVHALPHTPTNSPGEPRWRLLTYLFPEDVNRQQSFDLPFENSGAGRIPQVVESESIGPQAVDQIKLVFEESSDFFGRITIYNLCVEGYELHF
ncbi:hypothetical protein K439DRAFT_1335481 [Ramaria rubella]|nr:hypothetical protein K439DRAFT_1335481 [Ramaria rubella]